MSATSTTTQQPRDSSVPGGIGRAVAVVVGLAVLAFLLGFTLGTVGTQLLSAVGIDVSFGSSSSATVFLFTSLTGQGAMAIVAYLYVRRYGLRVPAYRPSMANYRAVAVGLVAALALGLGGAVVVNQLFPVDGSESVFGGVASLTLPTALAYGAIAILIVAPAEEFLFRGVIQGRLRESMGVTPAIVGASLLFGAFHILNYTGSATSIVAHVGVIVVVAFVFAYAYERTDNIVVPILIHGVYDATLFLVATTGL